MKVFIKILSAFIIILGALMIFKPYLILSWIEESLYKNWFYWVAILFRIILGTILIISAKESKFPVFIKVIGYLSISAAVLFVIIGQESFQNFFAGFFPHFDGYAPVSGFIGIAMGAILFYSFLEEKLVKGE